MKYNVGDKVVIKTWETLEKQYGLDSVGDIELHPCVNEMYMKKYCGYVVTISKVRNMAYDIVEDNGKWYWTDDMIEGPVPVYKPGDKVKIREWDDLVEVYGKNGNGNILAPGATFDTGMREYCGRIMTIKERTQLGNYKIEEDFGCWYFSPAAFTKVEPEKEVFVAYRDGQEVVGLHKINNEIVKKTVAKCHPDDTFDFMVGAKLAMERMEEDEQETDHGLRIGDLVEVTNSKRNYSIYLDWFKVYQEMDLGLRYAYGNAFPTGVHGTVKAIHPHTLRSDITLVAIEDPKGVVFLVAEEGLRRVG